MTCRRTSEIDLPGFLDDPRRPGFAEFREHYPRCRDCAAEVRVWTELQAALRAGRPAPAHPEPEQLARYDGAPADLAPTERRALEAHLGTCAACRDELRALHGWAPTAQVEPFPARAAAPGRGGSWLAALRRLLWNPALAYALLAAFVAPTLYRQVVGQPPLIERAAEPPALAKAEKARPVEEPPAAAGERSIPAELAHPSEPTLTRSAEARPESVPEPIPPAETPPASVPERKASVEPPRAAAPPPPAVARLRPAPEPAVAGRVAPELGVAREALTAEADRATAPTPLVQAAPTPALGGIARELSAQDAEEAAFADDALAELPAAPATALALRPGEIPTVSAASARAGLRLSVTVPEPGAGEVEVRVVAPGGGRELRERRPSDARAATIELPPGWLVPGRHEVLVQSLGAGLVTGEAHYAFEVAPEDEARLER